MSSEKNAPPEEATGYCMQARKSEWVGVDDFPTEDKVVEKTIIRVMHFPEIQFDTGKQTDLYALQIAESGRMYKHLNATLTRKLKCELGSNFEDWKGQAVELYIDPNAKLGRGKRGPGVAIRKAQS